MRLANGIIIDKEMLSRLTLEEKTKLMMDASPAISRLGIPQFQWWNEALHGVARKDQPASERPLYDPELRDGGVGPDLRALQPDPVPAFQNFNAHR